MRVKSGNNVFTVLGGPGLYDPCEKEPNDAAAALSNQEREDITASAQVSLVSSLETLVPNLVNLAFTLVILAPNLVNITPSLVTLEPL